MRSGKVWLLLLVVLVAGGGFLIWRQRQPPVRVTLEPPLVALGHPARTVTLVLEAPAADLAAVEVRVVQQGSARPILQEDLSGAANPVVVFDSVNYFVAWSARGDLYAMRITPTGTMLEPPVAISTESGTETAVAMATDGRGRIMLVYYRFVDGSGRNNKKVVCSRNGVRVELNDEDGQESLTLKTPGGQQVVLKDGAASIELTDSSGNSVKCEASGITISTSAKLTISASTIDVTASMVKVSAGMSQFSGVVQCDTLITNSVVSSSYTPGAGNIW